MGSADASGAADRIEEVRSKGREGLRSPQKKKGRGSARDAFSPAQGNVAFYSQSAGQGITGGQASNGSAPPNASPPQVIDIGAPFGRINGVPFMPQR